MAKLTEQRIHDRRKAIIVAAEALFAERGFAETSMAEIVQASGVATGTVYRYFDSKEAVVMAVSESAAGVRFDADDGDPLPLPEAMKALISAATDRRRGRLSNQVWARAAGSPSLQSMIAERQARVYRLLARSIDQTASEPSPQALQRAEVIICAISGLQQRIASGMEVDADAFTATLLAWAVA
ncbi:TetR/AcrR family transcriptional regulator [Actinoallomurus sp. CA-150999]|uniref:TetR/AcrR family transcriptional regulator n=1 Tax=Actinoallomurus sp. CA-150999 TaxID=3239887 RepID=UPI003D8A7BE5